MKKQQKITRFWTILTITYGQKKHHCITQTKTQWSVEYDKNITVL